MAIDIGLFNFLTKVLVNKRATSSNKAVYEEIGDFTINISNSEIWAEDIDPDPAVAAGAGIVFQYTLFTLTEDITVSGQQSYYADNTGTRLKDWVSDKYGSNYGVTIYQNNGDQLFPTDPSIPFFNYQTGILTFEESTASLSKPFKISGYRYIGQKGITAGTGGGGGLNDIDGGTFLDTYNDTSDIDGGTFL